MQGCFGLRQANPVIGIVQHKQRIAFFNGLVILEMNRLYVATHFRRYRVYVAVDLGIVSGFVALQVAELTIAKENGNQENDNAPHAE